MTDIRETLLELVDAVTIGKQAEYFRDRKESLAESLRDAVAWVREISAERDALKTRLEWYEKRERAVRALIADCLDGDESAYASDVDHDNQARLARAVRDFRVTK